MPPTAVRYSSSIDFPALEVDISLLREELQALTDFDFIVTGLAVPSGYTEITTRGSSPVDIADSIYVYFSDTPSAATLTALDGDTAGPAGGLIGQHPQPATNPPNPTPPPNTAESVGEFVELTDVDPGPGVQIGLPAVDGSQLSGLGFTQLSGPLAELNAAVSDATLDDLNAKRDPKVHPIAGVDHSPSTLIELNSKISDATLDDSGSSRPPLNHASTHEQGGGDELDLTGLSGVLADPQTPSGHASSHQDGGSDEIATTTPTAGAIPKALPSGNLSDGFISESSVVQHQGAIDHDSLSGFELDEHRRLDDSQTSLTTAWSSQKIQEQISAALSGQDVKDSVDTVAKTNITLSGEQTISGLLTSNSRVGVVGQSDPAENGIYITSAGVWTRAPDFDSSAEVSKGLTFAVSDGDLAGYKYVLQTSDPITLGTTGLSFAEIKRLELGTGAGQAAEGNDSRFPTPDEKSALSGTSGTPSGSNAYVTNQDSRLSDSRSPTSHASTHQHGGGDELAVASASANAIPKAGANAKLDNSWINDASPTLKGLVELATNAEAAAGTDSQRAVTPAALASVLSGSSGGGKILGFGWDEQVTDVSTSSQVFQNLGSLQFNYNKQQANSCLLIGVSMSASINSSNRRAQGQITIDGSPVGDAFGLIHNSETNRPVGKTWFVIDDNNIPAGNISISFRWRVSAGTLRCHSSSEDDEGAYIFCLEIAP